jgi:hypothetical protein
MTVEYTLSGLENTANSTISRVYRKMKDEL